MTITNIIEKKKSKEEIRNQEEREITIQLAQAFNKKAKEKGIKYKMDFSDGEDKKHLNLYRKSWLNYWTPFGDFGKLIFYRRDKNEFSFCSGISAEVLNDIKQVLEAIPFKFEIELSDGKIPSEYSMLKELEKEDENKDKDEDEEWI